MGRRIASKSQVKKLALDRIRNLWRLASSILSTNPTLAKRYMTIASKIAQKARIKVPLDIKRRVCRKCGSVYIPGRNCRTRMRSNRSTHMTVTCLVCGDVRRFYAREQR